MRRLWFLVPTVLLAAVALLTPAASVRLAGVSAQDATPAAEDEEFEEITEGVTFELLGLGQAAALPPAPADLQLFRLGLAPGTAFPLDPEDPSVGLVYVEAGAIVLLVDTPLTVLRYAGGAEPGPENVEAIPAGEEVTLEEGDSVLFPARVGGELRNDGDEAASLLVANVFPLGDQAEGTPAATPAA